MLHNYNKVENRVACSEYARNSHEADPSRDSGRDIYLYVRLFFFLHLPCSRKTGSRAAARSLTRSADLSDDFGILLDRAVIEIGFAARCVTFAGFRANIETQRISFAHRRARCNRKSNGRPSLDRSRFWAVSGPQGRSSDDLEAVNAGFDCFRKRHAVTSFATSRCEQTRSPANPLCCCTLGLH